MLPDLDGFDVCKRLRQTGDRTPVLFLTARDATEDKVRGLTLGGDDYLVKPFSLEELVARITAVLRRAGRRPGGRRAAVRRPRRWTTTPTSCTKAGPGGQPVPHRVQPAALPADEQGPGGVEGPDPRPRVGLRLRRRRRRGGDLHRLPAPQARHRRAAPDPDDPRRGLHAPGARSRRPMSLRARLLLGARAHRAGARRRGRRHRPHDRRRPGRPGRRPAPQRERALRRGLRAGRPGRPPDDPPGAPPALSSLYVGVVDRRRRAHHPAAPRTSRATTLRSRRSTTATSRPCERGDTITVGSSDPDVDYRMRAAAPGLGRQRTVVVALPLDDVDESVRPARRSWCSSRASPCSACSAS